MNVLKNHIVPIYLNGSIHVSLAVWALIQMTFYFCKLPFDGIVSMLGFFGTLFSYNFIKYISVLLYSNKPFSRNLKIIFTISGISLLLATFAFFSLNIKAQVACFFLLILSIFYAVPLRKGRVNLRNFAGIKVYIVCFSWASVTLIVPVLNAEVPITGDILLKFTQRFILVFILIGIFEIVDLAKDSKDLKTLPQTLGISNTKILLFLCLVVFYVLEFFKLGFSAIQAYNNAVLVGLTTWFIYKASKERGAYYTLFWVESVPIVWWIIIVIEKRLSLV